MRVMVILYTNTFWHLVLDIGDFVYTLSNTSSMCKADIIVTNILWSAIGSLCPESRVAHNIMIMLSYVLNGRSLGCKMTCVSY